MNKLNENLSLSLKILLKNGIHFGHNISKYNSLNKPYIFGIRNKTYMLNLEHTFYQLKKVLLFLKHSNFSENTILFVGTKKHLSFLTKLIAKKCNQMYIDVKWTPGILTNHKQLRNFVETLILLESKIVKNESLTQDELTTYKKLKHKYGGFINNNRNGLANLPKLIVIFNPEDEDGIMAINESSQMLIPSIGIVDTDCSPLNITYPIPGNNNSIESISMFGSLLTNILNKK
jgi:small subunit ribosomal protein S2